MIKYLSIFLCISSIKLWFDSFLWGVIVVYKYNSFKEYIQLNYIETIQEALGQYIKQNDLTIFDEDTGNSHTYEDFNISTIKVSGRRRVLRKVPINPQFYIVVAKLVRGLQIITRGRNRIKIGKQFHIRSIGLIQ